MAEPKIPPRTCAKMYPEDLEEFNRLNCILNFDYTYQAPFAKGNHAKSPLPE